MYKISNSFVLSLLSVVVASAQCTVVVAPEGNDSNPGTFSAPFATPNAGVRNASPGDVVCLRGGTYLPTSEIVVDKPLTIQSYPGEWAVLTADATDASPVSQLFVVGAHDVTIQDLELNGGSSYGIHVSSYILGYPPANTRILRTKVHHSGYLGIKVDQSDNLQIMNSEVYLTGARLGGGGLDVLASIPGGTNPSGPGATLRGNYVHDVTGPAIVVKGGTVRGVVENNRVERITGGDIYAGGDTGAPYFRDSATSECFDYIVRNNLVSGTDAMGLGCWAAQGAKIVNNTVINAARVNQAALFVVPDSIGNACNNTTIQNNIFVTSGSSRMVHVVNPGPGMAIDYNHYYNSGNNYAMWWESSSLTGYWQNLGTWQVGTGQDSHSVSFQDPLLDAANSYKPLAGSPVVDSGVTLAVVPTDFAGVVRPQGRAFDKGAFELPSVSVPVPALLSATSGSGQSATTGTAFGTALAAKVTDTTGQGVAGVVVTFAAPSSGASASFSGSSSVATISDAKGVASSGAVAANGIAGSYAVTASAGSLTPVFFPLLNVAPPPPALLPTAVKINGGTVMGKATSFPVDGTVSTTGGMVRSGVLQFFVDGNASGSAEVKNGRVKWNMPIPAGSKSGTQFSVYAVFNPTTVYAGSRSATVIVLLK